MLLRYQPRRLTEKLEEHVVVKIIGYLAELCQTLHPSYMLTI